MPKSKITTDEIQALIEQIEKENKSQDDVYTAEEIGEKMGLSPQTVRQRLKKWLKDGLVINTRKKILCVDGLYREVSAYKIVKRENRNESKPSNTNFDGGREYHNQQ